MSTLGIREEKWKVYCWKIRKHTIEAKEFKIKALYSNFNLKTHLKRYLCHNPCHRKSVDLDSLFRTLNYGLFISKIGERIIAGRDLKDKTVNEEPQKRMLNLPVPII